MLPCCCATLTNNRSILEVSATDHWQCCIRIFKFMSQRPQDNMVCCKMLHLPQQQLVRINGSLRRLTEKRFSSSQLLRSATSTSLIGYAGGGKTRSNKTKPDAFPLISTRPQEIRSQTQSTKPASAFCHLLTPSPQTALPSTTATPALSRGTNATPALASTLLKLAGEFTAAAADIIYHRRWMSASGTCWLLDYCPHLVVMPCLSISA